MNVTKFRIQILCSLHCVIGRSARTIEVLRLHVSVYKIDISTSMVWAVLHAAKGPLFLVTFSTMLSMLALLEVACPLATSMRLGYMHEHLYIYLRHILSQHKTYHSSH